MVAENTKKWEVVPDGNNVCPITWRKQRAKPYWKGYLKGKYLFYIRYAQSSLTYRPYILSSNSPFLLGNDHSFNALAECKMEAKRKLVLLADMLLGEPQKIKRRVG